MGPTWMAVVVVCLLTGDTNPPAPRPPVPHLRGVNPAAQRVIDSALARSPTVRDLVARLDASDVIAYVQISMAATKTAHTVILDAAGPVRYLLVSLNPLGSSETLLELLGHELQHVMEIADARGVRNDNQLVDLYRRIGLSATASDCFETMQAQSVGRRVRDELVETRRTAYARKQNPKF